MLRRQPAQAGLTDDTMQHVVGGSIRLAAFWRLSDRAPRSFVSRDSLRPPALSALTRATTLDSFFRAFFVSTMNHRVFIFAAPDPDKALVIPELSLIVVSMPFAPVSQANIARGPYPPPAPGLGFRYAELPQWAAVYYFLPRCTMSLVDVTRFRARDIMQFALLATCWERILNEWANLGLFAAVHSSEEEFFKKQKELLASRPALPAGALDPFMIAGADLDASAQSWRRPDGVLGAEPFEFLTFVDLLSLYDPTRAAPLDALCELMRLLGPVYTRAIRQNESSVCVAGALALKSTIIQAKGLSPRSGPQVVAMHLPSLLWSILDDFRMCPGNADLSPKEVLLELRARAMLVNGRDGHRQRAALPPAMDPVETASTASMTPSGLYDLLHPANATKVGNKRAINFVVEMDADSDVDELQIQLSVLPILKPKKRCSGGSMPDRLRSDSPHPRGCSHDRGRDGDHSRDGIRGCERRTRRSPSADSEGGGRVKPGSKARVVTWANDQHPGPLRSRFCSPPENGEQWLSRSSGGHTKPSFGSPARS